MLILSISHGGGGSEGKTVKDQHEMIVYTNLLTGGTLSGCINSKKLKVKKCVGDKTFIIKDTGRVQKKNWGKVWSFAKPGGGVSEGGQKTKLLF